MSIVLAIGFLLCCLTEIRRNDTDVWESDIVMIAMVVARLLAIAYLGTLVLLDATS